MAHRSKGALKKISYNSCRDRKELVKLSEKYKNFWEKGQRLESPDGTVRVIGYHNIERQIIRHGKKKWVKQHNFSTPEIDSNGLSFLSYTDYLPYSPYVMVDKEEGDPDLLILDFELDKWAFEIRYTDKGMEITQIDDKGEVKPIKVANLSKVNESSHPLFKAARRFADPKYSLCLVNTETQKVEELNLFYLNLRFIRNARGLECVQYPGYFLQSDKTLEEINHFPAALILKNHLGETKVIIPATELRSIEGDFSTEVRVTRKFFAQADSSRYFVFKIDQIDGSLRSDKVEANLYLTYLLKLKKDTRKALKYLKRVKINKKLRDSENRFLKGIRLITDSTPSSLAFDAKLFYFIVNNKGLMLESRFGKQERDSELINWGKKAYLKYTKERSRFNLSSIPKDLQITDDEERAILYFLKRYYDKAKKDDKEKDFPQLLNLRYGQLCTQRGSTVVKITPDKISCRPPIYPGLVKPSKLKSLRIGWDSFDLGENRKMKAEEWENLTLHAYPNRLTTQALEAHFPALYEEARQCLPGRTTPFDFTLLACLKVKTKDWDNNSEQLSSLLFYVRHFPHLFAHLSIEKCSNDAKRIQVFNQIVIVASKLEDLPEYQRFVRDFLEQTVTFDYSLATNLTHHRPNDAARSISLEEGRPFEAPPFRVIRRGLFKKKIVRTNFPTEPLFIDKTLCPPDETLENDLVSNFKAGYEAIRTTRKRITFSFKEANLEGTKKAIFQAKKRYHRELIAERKRLLTLLNTTYKVRGKNISRSNPIEEIEFRLGQKTGQHLTLTPELVMKEVILRNNPGFLKKHAPLLSKKESKQLVHDVCHYYYKLVLYEVAMEATVLVDALAKDPHNLEIQNNLANLLDYEFDFDPLKYPEISYFKVTNGKLPRPAQLKIYKWVCEGLEIKENRLFQHKAGGGKTDYLTPLFMLRAKRMGLTPIFLSTPLIYSVDKENLTYTMETLDQNFAYLEIGLHTRLSEEDLKFIYTQLTSYNRQGRGLIMTPQTYYTLRLQYFHAGLQERDPKKVLYLGLILKHLKTKCLALGDEAHQNYDPLTRAIFGVGDFFNIPKNEHALFINLLKPLLGFEKALCPDKRTICDVALMGSNHVGTPSDKDIKLVQRGLAKHMCAVLEIPKEAQKGLIDYWTNKKANQPAYLKAMRAKDKKRADQIALIGYFIIDLLPHIINLRTELDHAPSIYPEEEFDTPCHHKNPSTAQYQDPYLSVVTSIKGTAHRGLSPLQVRGLISKLLKQDWKEQRENPREESKSCRLFASWMAGSKLESCHLRDVSLSNRDQMDKLYAILSKHPKVIENYLAKMILPQIGYCLQQLTATPAHLSSGFAQSVIFTATPGSLLLYPRSVKAVSYSADFEAEVATHFSTKRNQTIIPTKGPENFFKEMEENKKFSEISVFIDPSGFFCDMQNHEVAKNFLEKNKTLDGVLYFKEGRSATVDKDEKICLLLRSDPDHPIELLGSDIKKALAAHKLDWEKLKLGTYYDAAHTESANIRQKKGAIGMVFMVDNLTIARLIQALMRMRGFLDLGMKQSICWVCPEGVLPKIPLSEAGTINGASIFAWAVKNEVDQMKKRIVLRAFQEIAFLVEAQVNKELEACSTDGEKQIHIMNKYSKGLLDITTHDPYAVFADHERDEEAKKILMGYAEDLYRQYGYTLPFEENTHLIDELEGIIIQTTCRIATISTSLGEKFSAEVEHHTRMKKETNQEDYRPRHYDPLAGEQVVGKLKVTNPEYPYVQRKRSTQSIFKCSHLTKRCYFEINQLRTAINAGESLNEKFLKPIDYFEIIIPEGSEPMAVVHSNDMLEGIYQELIKGTDDPDVHHTIFIVSAEGKLIHQGRGRLKPKKKDIEKILKSDWMKSLVMDAALLKGEIPEDKDLFLERVAKWEGFAGFWERVVKAQPNPEVTHRNAMLRLLRNIKK